jgi:microcin C transport system substrate-binding protein
MKQFFSAKCMLAATLAMGFFLAGCPKPSGDNAPADDKSGPSYQVKLWKKFDTPPGADPSIPDTLGGAGFEKIADKLGFTTTVPTKEDIRLSGDPRAKTGGMIRFTISRFPLSFRPFFYGQGANFTENYQMTALCYETLLGLNLRQEYAGALATHWKVENDGMKFTFRIDPNARFSSGAPVTAEDVVATFKLIMDESILSPSMQQTYSRYETPVALSKYLVSVVCKEKNWRNLQTFATGLSILSAKEIGGMTGKEFLDKFQFNQPVGSGEYIVLTQDIQKQQSYTFTRRDDYWGKDYPTAKYSGNFDRISFEVIKDNPTLEYEKFKKGEIDKFWFTGNTTDRWLGDTTYEALVNNWVKRDRVFTDGAVGTSGYFLNMRKPPFDDIRIRKAMYHLFDRNSIIKEILFNEYMPIHSFYSNTAYEFPNNPKYDYNPELAGKLLAEAGYTSKNKDGILVKNGRPFQLEIGIVKPLEKFVTPYQQTLRQAGIDLQIKFQDGNSITKNIAERNFNITWANYGGLEFPNPETSIKSELADKNDNNNITGFKNAAADQLCDRYKLAFEQKERVEIIRQVDSIETNTVNALLAWTPKGIRIAYWDKFGVPEWVLGKTAQLGDHDLSIMSGWWFDAAKAKALEEAKKNKTKLPGSHAIREVSYWKNLKK